MKNKLSKLFSYLPIMHCVMLNVAIAIIIKCKILKAMILINKMEKNKYIHITTILILINLMLIYIGIKYNRI